MSRDKDVIAAQQMRQEQVLESGQNKGVNPLETDNRTGKQQLRDVIKHLGDKLKEQDKERNPNDTKN